MINTDEMYEKFKEILNTLTESDLEEWLEFDKKRLLESNIWKIKMPRCQSQVKWDGLQNRN